MTNIANEYRFNKNFQRYVDAYCEIHNITVEEALEDELVKKVSLYYTEI